MRSSCDAEPRRDYRTGGASRGCFASRVLPLQRSCGPLLPGMDAACGSISATNSDETMSGHDPAIEAVTMIVVTVDPLTERCTVQVNAVYTTAFPRTP